MDASNAGKPETPGIDALATVMFYLYQLRLPASISAHDATISTNLTVETVPGSGSIY